MNVDGKSIAIDISAVPEIAFPIPGATPDGVFARLVNIDASKGIVTTVIHIMPGARIPAHYHKEGAEAHFVLEGDFINEGVSYGPGTFITHAKGVVHGPHTSMTGARILTLQTSYVDPARPDFNIAE